MNLIDTAELAKIRADMTGPHCPRLMEHIDAQAAKIAQQAERITCLETEHKRRGDLLDRAEAAFDLSTVRDAKFAKTSAKIGYAEEPATATPTTDHSGDAAEKSEPPRPAFVCPKCGGNACRIGFSDRLTCLTGTAKTDQSIGSCDWCGSLADVAAAQAKASDKVVVCAKTVDGEPLTAEQAKELNEFVNSLPESNPSPLMAAMKTLRLHFGFGPRQFAELVGVKPSDWAGLEHGRMNLMVDSTLEKAIVTLAAKAKASESAGESDVESLKRQLAQRDEQMAAATQRAERAEAGAAGMRPMLERIVKCTRESDTHNWPSLKEMVKALDSTAGAALLAKLRALEQICREMLAVMILGEDGIWPDKERASQIGRRAEVVLAQPTTNAGGAA